MRVRDLMLATAMICIVDVAQAATNGNDQITGTAKGDTIHGLDGNDIISGLGGNDLIYGGRGYDNIQSGLGNDHLLGGPDADFIYGQKGDDLLEGGSGRDAMFGGPGRDILHGGDGKDHLFGNMADMPDTVGNLLYGEGDDDHIEVTGTGATRDKTWGGPGNDSFTFIGMGGLAYGEAGNDIFSLYIGTTARPIRTTAFIYGGEGADSISIVTPSTDGTPRMATFIDWQPGVDILSGVIFVEGNTEVIHYVRQWFDTNHDGHVDFRDGPMTTAVGHSLTFPINPVNGLRGLQLKIFDFTLYLPNSSALF